jgi:hypothetical protein
MVRKIMPAVISTIFDFTTLKMREANSKKYSPLQMPSYIAF